MLEFQFAAAGLLAEYRRQLIGIHISLALSSECARSISGAGDGRRPHHKATRSAGVDGAGGTSPVAFRPSGASITRPQPKLVCAVVCAAIAYGRRAFRSEIGRECRKATLGKSRTSTFCFTPLDDFDIVSFNLSESTNEFPKYGSGTREERMHPLLLTLLVLVVSHIWAAGSCGAQTVSAPEARNILAQRFTDLHQMYLSTDAKSYTSILRATLRHARRLSPDQCVDFQRTLVTVGNAIGYDGLEPVWAIYQDCAAAATAIAARKYRSETAALLKKGLHFRREESHPQLSVRVSYWNTTIERGVRPDAVRILMRQFANADPTIVQGWTLGQLVSSSATRAALCALPQRLDQTGEVALPELLRSASCLTGTRARIKDVCDKLFHGRTTDSSASIPATDLRRLQDTCDRLPTGTALAGAGIDNLDNFATDQCTSEDSAHLYDTGKIAGLIEDCYFGSQGNPLAAGSVSSANFDTILNEVVTWPRGPNDYAASLITGQSSDDPGRNIYLAEGHSPQDARQNLLDQLVRSPPSDSTVSRNEDGSVTATTSRDQTNPDGTTSHTDSTTQYGTDGSSSTSWSTRNSDGTGAGGTSQAKPDSSSTSTTLTWDKDGNVTQKVETTTDKDGKTTTSTTQYEHNSDGEITDTKTSTTSTDQLEPGHFDPHNPACQQLMTLDIGPGGGRKMWNDAFKRPYWIDPRSIDPTPTQVDHWSEEPYCGAPGLGGSDAAPTCKSAVLCSDDTEIDVNSCTCKRPVTGQIAARGCFAVDCSEGSVPIPIGSNACMCAAAVAGGGGVSLPPRPSPEVVRALGELMWNRPDGSLLNSKGVADTLRGGGSGPPR